MRRHRSIWLAVAAAVAWTVVVAVPARSDAARSDAATSHVGTVTRGRPLFWDGPQDVEVRATLDCTDQNCWRYTFDVPAGVNELRVAAQASVRSEFWSISITNPSGQEVWADGNAPFGAPLAMLQRWGIEHRIKEPARGTWTVRLLVQDTEVPLDFELRAGIGDLLDAVGGPPNLRVRPPYEIGVVAPASPTSGMAVDRHNAAMPAGGVGPTSCTWDEVLLAAEHGAVPPVRCLRFSVGVYEAGEGRVQLRLDGHQEDLERAFTSKGRVEQLIHEEDGTITAHDAGDWEFHMTHGHAHYLGFVHYDIARVVETANGPPVDWYADSGKTGYYMVDQRIADFSSFAQDPQHETQRVCPQPQPYEEGQRFSCIGMGAGWEDHYRWQRPGQYVPLPDEDGLYVLRVVTNVNALDDDEDTKHLQETNYDDNSAYALVRITGGAVEVCERGVGDHPWADDAQPVADEWHAVRGGTPGALSSCAV